MHRSCGELFSRSTLAEQEDVRVRLRCKRDLLAEPPDDGRLAEDAERIGRTESADAILRKETKRRHERGASNTVDEELAAKVHDVAGRDTRGLAALPVHLQATATDAFDADFVSRALDDELPP